VDPATHRPCAPGVIGEVWVDSPTKGLGYWGLEAQTYDTFHARLADEYEDGRGYLRTGDLGFFHDGELFITGRSKDLIIMRGRNLYPVDIEDSVRDCHPLIRPGGLAAFAVDVDGGEQLALFVEARRDRLSPAEIDEVIESVRRQVYAEFQLGVHAIVLGRSGTVRKTTSGKVRRLACRQAYLSGDIANASTTLRVAVNDAQLLEVS
jgi:acyl-CoA synthetase (AMP-forming)/AMP-acid ligase II